MSFGVLTQNIVFFGVGGVLLVCGAALSPFWPILFNSKIEEQLVLTNQSKSYSLWKETPIPMYLEIHMFNWTNPLDTVINGAKPSFVEMGPYVFSEHHSKVNLKWNKNGTITFNQVRKWKFIPEQSKGSLSDKVTNVNVIAMTVGKYIANANLPRILYPVINEIIKFEEKDVTVTKTVKELLFDGYHDQFLDIMDKLKNIIKKKLPFDKFGWFYQRNNSATYDGVINMNTGASSLNDLGNIIYWNYKKKSSSFRDACSDVSGTTGELWPADSAQNEKIKIFSTDICSSITLKKDSSVTLDGVDGVIHIGDDESLDNGQKNINNRCFCSGGNCPPSGARNISVCRFGAPAFISFPHFYLADPLYATQVAGMNPDPVKHRFSITLDKLTSVPIDVHARLQINIRSSRIDGINFYKGLPDAYMPMLWFDQRALISPSLAQQLKSIQILDTYLEPIFITIAVLGLILVVIGLLFWMKRMRKNKNIPTPLLSETNTSTN